MEPLIYTSKGNLPLSSLVERVIWEDGPDETICRIEHLLDGEIVRSQPNVFKRTGQSMLSTAGVI